MMSLPHGLVGAYDASFKRTAVEGLRYHPDHRGKAACMSSSRPMSSLVQSLLPLIVALVVGGGVSFIVGRVTLGRPLAIFLFATCVLLFVFLTFYRPLQVPDRPVLFGLKWACFMISFSLWFAIVRAGRSTR